jgi:hypothetical protein
MFELALMLPKRQAANLPPMPTMPLEQTPCCLSPELAL